MKPLKEYLERALDSSLSGEDRADGLIGAFVWDTHSLGWDFWNKEHLALEIGRGLSQEAEDAIKALIAENPNAPEAL